MRAAFETLAIFAVSLPARVTSSSLKPRDNPLGIFYGPAPSPEDGPPASANALRDKAYLPAEIGGIVGAYVLFVSVIGIALFIVNRRFRRSALLKARDVEMVQPTLAHYNPYQTPISPTLTPGHPGNFTWPSPEKTDRNPYVFPTSYGSPISPGSDPAVDSRVVTADRELLQQDLEDLYAHVMEQDAAKAAGVDISELPNPVYIQHQAAIPSSSPQRGWKSKLEKSRPAAVDTQHKPEKTHSRTASLISSLKSPLRKSTKSLQISSPMPTPLAGMFPESYTADEDRPSSRVYGELPPPPPVPANQVPYTRTNSRNTSSTDPSPVSAYNEKDTAPLNTPYRAVSPPAPQTQQPTEFQRIPKKGPPAGLTMQPSLTITTTPMKPPTAQIASTSRPLPFRAFDPPPGLASPGASQTSFKTTVLQRLPDKNGGLATGGLKSPWSAGAVPYSPYQPQTPLIPVTPRLVTRKERKMKERLESRRPVLEMVEKEDDMWDSGY